MKKILLISTCLVLFFAVQSSKPLEPEYKGTTQQKWFNNGSELKIYWEKGVAGISTLYVDEKLKTKIIYQGKHTTDFPTISKAMCGKTDDKEEVLTNCEDADLLVQPDGKLVITNNRGYMEFNEIPKATEVNDTSK